MTRTSDRRVDIRRDPLLTEKIVYSVGPQHPSLPAPVHLLVEADGELIERVTPDIGYMHRGIEQLATTGNYQKAQALLSRCEWLAGSNGDYLVSAALEQLVGIEVPENAKWLRMLVLELSRIASHLFWWGQIGLEAGAITPVFWAQRERESILDLLEMLSGHRWHHGYITPGGVKYQPIGTFYHETRKFLNTMPTVIHRFEEFFSDNAIWINRSELIGTLEADYAMANGASGPVLRASSVKCDLRKNEPYLNYSEVDFEVPIGEYGDVLDRYRIRMAEMRESIHIAKVCLGSIDPAGEVLDPDAEPIAQIAPKAGEVYTAVESPRGELGLLLASDGTNQPVRLHLRSPSFSHLFLLNELCRGYLLADLFVILGSLDIMIGEVDR